MSVRTIETFEAGAGADGRFDRQARIEGWDQARVAGAHVLVVGAGAIGNEALKLLALVGVGRVTVVDSDRIENSNLSRTVLFRDGDVGAWKAEVAARRAAEIAPGLRAEAIVGDVEHDLGLGRVRAADAVLGCVDNLHARVAVNRACLRAGKPWVNAAIGPRAAEVGVFAGDGEGPCYECGLGEAAWRRFRRRFSCADGLRRAAREGRVATVATLASIAAALQVEALLALLHGAGRGSPLCGVGPGERAFLSIAPPLGLRKLALARDPACTAHERWDGEPRAIAASAREATADDLMAAVGGDRVELDWDLVTGLRCEACGEAEERLGPKGRLLAVEAACPRCRAGRRAETVSDVRRGEALACVPLARLGVPERAVLRVGAGARIELVELTGSGTGNGSGSDSGSGGAGA